MVLLAASLLVVGCGSSERPNAASWLPTWQALISVVPDEAELGDPPDEALCQTTLAAVREQSDGLLPTPSMTVDDLANEWASIAENGFFECPPAGEQVNSFEDVYRELRRVEDSVDTALADSG